MPDHRGPVDVHPEIWRASCDLAAHPRDVWTGLGAVIDLAPEESPGRRAEGYMLTSPACNLATWIAPDRADRRLPDPGCLRQRRIQAGDDAIERGEDDYERPDTACGRRLTSIGALAGVGKMLDVTGDSPYHSTVGGTLSIPADNAAEGVEIQGLAGRAPPCQSGTVGVRAGRIDVVVIEVPRPTRRPMAAPAWA